jgi:hypothetical protein
MRINYWAVGVAALAYWALGAVWYTLFAGPFIALMRWTPEQVARLQSEGAGKQIGVALVSSFVLAYVLAQFVRLAGAETAARGAQIGLWLFVGFVLTTNLETVLFEFRPLGLYLINNGYHLVGMLGMGALLAAWKRRDARVPAYQT